MIGHLTPKTPPNSSDDMKVSDAKGDRVCFGLILFNN